MKGLRLSLLVALGTMVAGSTYVNTLATGPMPMPMSVAPMHTPVRTVEIDLNKATPLKLPTIKFDLKVTKFVTPTNHEGWAIRLPGNRPIATPAYYNGMLFVGGGYGSHEFYAFDARTGAMAWKYVTGDDGPTAAVVDEGYCAFNTESCTVYVLDAKTGKLAWSQWLGDPLMSQPAIWNGKLYIAYPAGSPRPVHSQHAVTSHAGANAQNINTANIGAPLNVASANVADDANNDFHAPESEDKTAPSKASNKPERNYSHRLLCADLKTGKHYWDVPITSDVMSAPVLSGGKLYLTCMDGTAFTFDGKTGKKISETANSSTSAPIVQNGRMIVAQKIMVAGKTYESLSSIDGAKTSHLRRAQADYLSALPGAQPVAGLTKAVEHAQDASVGFATAPPAAGLSSVQGNIPIGGVVAGWAYQGSRAAFNSETGMIANAQGGNINVVSDKSEDNWVGRATGRGVNAAQQTFSPPALGKENIYLASGDGHLLALDQKSGSVKFDYAIQEPVAFQPALAGGNMYVGTANGLLVCLPAGTPDADGWSGWGGNARHNKE